MIIEHLSKGLQIDLNRRVLKVDTSGAAQGRGVAVTAQLPGGETETLAARAVVVAVPLSIMLDGDIAFSPPLPEETTRAFQGIGWQRNGVKILCARERDECHQPAGCLCLPALVCCGLHCHLLLP